jgi:hypothetical protein
MNTPLQKILQRPKSIIIGVLFIFIVIFALIQIFKFINSGSIQITTSNGSSNIMIFDEENNAVVEEVGSTITKRLPKGDYVVEVAVSGEDGISRAERLITVEGMSSDKYHFDLVYTKDPIKIGPSIKSTELKVFENEIQYLDQSLHKIFTVNQNTNVVTQKYISLSQIKDVEWISDNEVLTTDYLGRIIHAKGSTINTLDMTKVFQNVDGYTDDFVFEDLKINPSNKTFSVGVNGSIYISSLDFKDIRKVIEVEYEDYDISFTKDYLFVYRNLFAFPYPDADPDFTFNEEEFHVNNKLLNLVDGSIKNIDEVIIQNASFSPDSEFLAYDNGEFLNIIQVASGSLVRKLPETRGFTWSEDNLIYVSEKGIFKYNFNNSYADLLISYDSPGLSQQIKSVFVFDNGDFGYHADGIFKLGSINAAPLLLEAIKNLPVQTVNYRIEHRVSGTEIVFHITTFANEEFGASRFKTDTTKYRKEAIIHLESLGLDTNKINILYTPS